MGFDPEKVGATLTNGKLKHVATGLYKRDEQRGTGGACQTCRVTRPQDPSHLFLSSSRVRKAQRHERSRRRGRVPLQQRLQRPHHRQQEVCDAARARDVPQTGRGQVPLTCARSRLHQHPPRARGERGPAGAAAHAAASRQGHAIPHQGLSRDRRR